jgi:hypothetical protein
VLCTSYADYPPLEPHRTFRVTHKGPSRPTRSPKGSRGRVLAALRVPIASTGCQAPKSHAIHDSSQVISYLKILLYVTPKILAQIPRLMARKVPNQGLKRQCNTFTTNRQYFWGQILTRTKSFPLVAKLDL